MTYTEYTELPNAESRVLVEFDLGQNTVQWVNVGAGLWLCEFGNVYADIESSLIPASWDELDISDVGSVEVDSLFYLRVDTLAELTTTDTSWYWDRTNAELYVHVVNNQHPDMHTMTIGVLYGYSETEFTPVDAPQLYEGRLLDIPSFGVSRDPLFFGRLSFPGFSVTLANGDGEFNTWAEDNDIYGNQCRIKHGYAELDYDDYVTLYTGIMERVEMSEERLSVSIADRRSSLKRKVDYSCTAKNALEAIRGLLLDNYGIPYTSVFYDTTTWATAEAAAPDVTIDETGKEVIQLIENICTSVFGFFSSDTDGRFMFRFVDTSATSETTIQSYDVLNYPTVSYDPSEVVSSVQINYDSDGEYTDDTRESTVFQQYRVYNEQSFDTYLPDASAASALASDILDYTDSVHGATTITIPISNYALSVGETVDVVFDTVGTEKSEITSMQFSLFGAPQIEMGVRFV